MQQKEKILITGASTGIGHALTFRAHSEGHPLILLVRTPADKERMRQNFSRSLSGAEADVYSCDLSCKKDIESVLTLIDEKHQSIDILINNAALYTETREETIEGLELTFAVNTLAPYRLIQGLSNLLVRSSHPRVINICSIGERYAKLNFADPMSKLQYSGNVAYNNSKLLLTMVTYKFASLYKDSISFICVHPGATQTDLISDTDFKEMPILLRSIFAIMRKFRQHPERAASYIYDIAMTSALYTACGNFFDKSRPIVSSETSRDRNNIEWAWALCSDLA